MDANIQQHIRRRISRMEPRDVEFVDLPFYVGATPAGRPVGIGNYAGYCTGGEPAASPLHGIFEFSISLSMRLRSSQNPSHSMKSRSI
jgi:hypothetical protein